MRHLVVSRFSVPRLEPETAHCHEDESWLRDRLELLRRWYAPSVGRLGVEAVLLCSSASAPFVADRVRDLPWLRVAEQDDWRGGWKAPGGTLVTRHDSDDAIHEDWFHALEAAPESEAYGSNRFLRLDLERRRLYAYRRREVAPLVAFRDGADLYRWDHAELAARVALHLFDAPYLLQVVHGGNVKNRRPGWLRAYRRVPLRRLEPYGVTLG